MDIVEDDKLREKFYEMKRKNKQLRREAWLKAKGKTEEVVSEKDEKTSEE